MLIFFDESFGQSERDDKITLGGLCGIGIPEHQLATVAQDVYQLKYKHFGADFARDSEIKGKELLKNYVFNLQKKGTESKSLAFASDLIDYIVAKRLPVFGCVCFEKGMQKFQVDDVTALDKTFKFLFERIDTWIKRTRPNEMACLVFDDRDYGINQKNSTAITNFLQRSSPGLAMDSIVRTPFFAISQSQNVGLQLADFVTSVITRKHSHNPNIGPFYDRLKKAVPHWVSVEGHHVSGVKVISDRPEKPAAKKAPGTQAKKKRQATSRSAVGTRKPNTQRSGKK
ncbi:MAG: DUF3800 domain-containing protein [Xanthomonadales bacterium]|nr:DUF3800 domain-containing protein [Xanthomonadales bacterium]